MTWDVLLGYATGLRLFSPHIDPGTLLRTLLVMHALDSIMCRVVAGNSGYSKNLWTALGFVLGVWAVAVVMLLPKKKRSGLGARGSGLA